ncbi:MAG: hypothetical protein HYV27_09705 [Candidatus Hydrogenedentes bacterium]|nr:hypothetical protein [Candidatus Hydrogenedentota bacterium]
MKRPQTCPRCSGPLRPDAAGLKTLTPCPACRTPILVLDFPALYTSPSAPPARPVPAMEGAATCFYHEKHTAEAPCCHCGRYLCAVCAVYLGGKVYCTACLERFDEQVRAGKDQDPDNILMGAQRWNYTTLVLLGVLVLGFLALPIIAFLIAFFLSFSGAPI